MAQLFLAIMMLSLSGCSLLVDFDKKQPAGAGQSDDAGHTEDAGSADAGSADAGPIPDDGCGNSCQGDTVCREGKCVSVSGCSDGARESMIPISDFPYIAGCDANWSMASMRAAATGVACGNGLGACAVPADACGAGWHVCATPPYGPTDISSKISAEGCYNQLGEYAAAVGDRECEPCSSEGFGAACCGLDCIQQNGNCVFDGKTAWFGKINEHINLCSEIEAKYSGGQGVLCCVD